MKKGFTLAEVLITLAIIGVVAALTIPSVIVKTQQQEFKTAAKKAHSVLSQAMQLTEVQDGYSPYTDNSASQQEFLNALMNNMNIVKSESDGNRPVFYTADGIKYFIDGMGDDYVYFTVDVNGDKGPSKGDDLVMPQCNDNSCDANNPEWPGITLTDIFYIDFEDGRGQLYPPAEHINPSQEI